MARDRLHHSPHAASAAASSHVEVMTASKCLSGAPVAPLTPLTPLAAAADAEWEAEGAAVDAPPLRMAVAPASEGRPVREVTEGRRAAWP